MKARPILLAILFSAGCTLGPDYKRPEVPVPEGWREVSAAEQESLANTPWWELFQDPELVRLIQIALAENKDLAIAVERIEEARAIYGFTKADLYPKVNAYGSAGELKASRNGIPPIASGTDDQSELYQVGGSVSWELDFFGRVRRATEAQLAQLYATEEGHRAVVLALVAEVARVYVEMREFDRRLEIARSTVESRVRYVQLARDLFEGGKTSELDWRQAQAELQRVTAFVFEYERVVKQKENELSALLGHNPGEIPRGLSLEEMPVPSSVPAGLPSELLDRRPDLRQAEQQLASANARIGEAKALLYPSISLTGAFGWESTDLGNLFDTPSKAWSLSANVLQPIFNSGQLQSRVEVAESQERQALYGYERSILQAFREVEDSLVGLRQSGLRRGSEHERVTAERRVVDLAELRYRGGVTNYLEVLDAQRSLFTAEIDETATQSDEIVSLIQLYKALGGGWPQAPEPPANEAHEGQ